MAPQSGCLLLLLNVVLRLVGDRSSVRSRICLTSFCCFLWLIRCLLALLDWRGLLEALCSWLWGICSFVAGSSLDQNQFRSSCLLLVVPILVWLYVFVSWIGLCGGICVFLDAESGQVDKFLSLQDVTLSLVLTLWGRGIPKHQHWNDQTNARTGCNTSRSKFTNACNGIAKCSSNG